MSLESTPLQQVNLGSIVSSDNYKSSLWNVGMHSSSPPARNSAAMRECQFPHTMCALNFWPHIKRWIWFDSHFCLRFIRLPPWFERILRIEVCVSLLLAITDDCFIFVMKSCGQCDSTCRMSFWFNAIDRQNDEDFIILQYYHICINLSEIFLKYLYIIDHYIMVIN